jgi:hypothetical protein
LPNRVTATTSDDVESRPMGGLDDIVESTGRARLDGDVASAEYGSEAAPWPAGPVMKQRLQSAKHKPVISVSGRKALRCVNQEPGSLFSMPKSESPIVSLRSVRYTRLLSFGGVAAAMINHTAYST